MYFNQTRTVWFGRDFNRGVDDIHFGAWGDLAKECFDIVIPQTNTARTYPHANAEISVRTVKQINAAIGRQTNRMMAHWVIRSSRNYRRQLNSLCLIPRANVCRWRPGWVCTLVRNGGHHCRCQRVTT